LPNTDATREHILQLVRQYYQDKFAGKPFDPDYSPERLNGSFTGGPPWPRWWPGAGRWKSKTTLLFPQTGYAGRVTVPYNPWLRMGTDDMSIEFWCYPDGPGAVYDLITKDGYGGNQGYMLILI